MSTQVLDIQRDLIDLDDRDIEENVGVFPVASRHRSLVVIQRQRMYGLRRRQPRSGSLAALTVPLLGRMLRVRGLPARALVAVASLRFTVGSPLFTVGSLRFTVASLVLAIASLVLAIASLVLGVGRLLVAPLKALHGLARILVGGR